MANNPSPILDEKTVVQTAYQDTLKKMFGVMMDTAAGGAGSDDAIAAAKTHFQNGLVVLRKVRDAALDAVK